MVTMVFLSNGRMVFNVDSNTDFFVEKINKVYNVRIVECGDYEKSTMYFDSMEKIIEYIRELNK